MKTVVSKSIMLKLSVLAAAVVIGVFGLGNFGFYTPLASAASSGPSPSHTNAPLEDNCTACHTSFPVNSGTGGFTISGLPVNYLPNQQIPVTVTTSQSDATIYGFQLTAIDGLGRGVGTFTLPALNPAPTQIVTGIVGGNIRRYVEHTSNGLFTNGVFGSNTWTFTWTAPSTRVGKVSFYGSGNAANSDGGPGGDYIYTKSEGTVSGTAISSFDGDLRSDVAVWRPSDGYWYSLNSTNGGFQAIQFGQQGDIVVPGDYDGDGRTDRAVFRPSNGAWYVLRSTLGFTAIGFGRAGDIPVQGDYDGDGRTDFGVFRPSDSNWYIYQTTAGYSVVRFGFSDDKPVPGDYDADGKTDIAVYRPSNGFWYSLRSTLGFGAIQFGVSEDKPVPADYDGDGRTDYAVYRPSAGIWYELNSTTGFYAGQFGISTDIPTPADFDGDGKTDLAVYRPTAGYLYAFRSADSTVLYAAFGLNGDVPVASGYIPQYSQQALQTSKTFRLRP